MVLWAGIRMSPARRRTRSSRILRAPQCGFSSPVEGNALTYDEQVAKLSLIVETAAEVWG